MEMTGANPSTLERYEPQVRFAWGPALGLASLAAVGIALLDCLKFSQSRSPLRFSCVLGVVFAGVLAVCWFRSARNRSQTVILDEKSLTIETKSKRNILRWEDLVEVTIVGDSMLKLKCRHARGLFRLENQGFTQSQWRAIKHAFKARGFEFKIGYSVML